MWEHQVLDLLEKERELNYKITRVWEQNRCYFFEKEHEVFEPHTPNKKISRQIYEIHTICLRNRYVITFEFKELSLFFKDKMKFIEKFY